MWEDLKAKLLGEMQSALLAWLYALPGMALDYLGWGGIVGIAAGLLLLMAMSARCVKMLSSRRGLAVLGVLTAVGLYLMQGGTASTSKPPVKPPSKIPIVKHIDPEMGPVANLVSAPQPSIFPASSFATPHPAGGAGLPIVTPSSHHAAAPSHHATAAHSNHSAGAGFHPMMPHGGTAGGVANHQAINPAAIHVSAQSHVNPHPASPVPNGVAVNHTPHVPAKPEHSLPGGGGVTGLVGGGMPGPSVPTHPSAAVAANGHYQRQPTPQEMRNRVAEYEMNLMFSNYGYGMPHMNMNQHPGIHPMHTPQMGVQHPHGGGMHPAGGTHHPAYHIP